MNTTKFIKPQPSAFAQIVDGLRDKSEAELKMLYLRFFQKDLEKEWNDITKDSSLKSIPETDIIKAIQKNRYRG